MKKKDKNVKIRLFNLNQEKNILEKIIKFFKKRFNLCLRCEVQYSDFDGYFSISVETFFEYLLEIRYSMMISAQFLSL